MIKGRQMMCGSKFIRRALELIGRFRDDQRGNVLIIVGAAIIPLVGALGLATDTSRGYLVKARLSQAIDAAALAGGKVIHNTDRDDYVLKYFKANFPTSNEAAGFDSMFEADFMDADVVLESPVKSEDEDGRATLSLAASATIPTTFMRVLGFDDVTVSASTEVTRDIIGLDAVLSMDMSGSMGDSAAGTVKIDAATEAALNFLDAIYGTGDVDSPQITVDGTIYDLVHIGFVPWNAKVRVTVEGMADNTDSDTVTGFDTNPVTTQSQSTVYYGADVAGRYSPVPLLSDPATLPGGWSGCVYARYLGDAYNDNDGDVERGQVTLGSGAGEREWMAWEPMAVNDAEPRSGSWTSSEGPSGTRWRDSSDNGYRQRSCNNAYFNDAGSTNYDNADGSVRVNNGFSTSRPAAVPNPRTQGSGFLRFWADTSDGALLGSSDSAVHHYAQPNIGNKPGNSECVVCLSLGIIPLTADKSKIYDPINAIDDDDPEGTTNIQQGLYWAWEVLMPGVPFDQALEEPPFPRRRAIILLTDGRHHGGNGDAYKGRFGSGEPAGTVDLDVHGDISVDVDGNGTLETAPNNLNNRLRWVAQNVRGEGISLYVIALGMAGFDDAKELLESIATTNGTETYFYEADDPDQLNGIFEEIAASLTTVRVSM